MDAAQQMVAQTFRQESGRILASLISVVRDFELAQDALSDALLVALERWPIEGIPRNPGAWMSTIARRKAINRMHRESTLARKQLLLQKVLEQEEQRGAEEMDDLSIPDERLKLLFTCCHPALALEAQVALTLHTLGGLSTAEIANAFLVPHTTMAQRLVRAKRKIKEAGLPYRVPQVEAVGERVEAVLCVLYLIFNEGYSATAGQDLIRRDLCDEAIRLARVLTMLLAQESLHEALPEALGLLALMVLHDARSNARVGVDGAPLLLEEQDRSLWDQGKKREGLAILEEGLRMKNPGPYQIQAAISALHVQAERPEDTDWPQIVALYGHLWRLTPSPIIELNHAVAVAMADGPLAGLVLLDRPEMLQALSRYHLFHAARADLLQRAGRLTEASSAYREALTLCQNEHDRVYLHRRLTEVAGGAS